MSRHEQDIQSTGGGDFDQRARASYHEAAATLPPSLQGRLRAARREALQVGHGERRAPIRWPVAMPAALAVAVVLAFVIDLRGPRPAQTPPAQTSLDRQVEVTDTAAPPAMDAANIGPALPAASGADSMAADGMATDGMVAEVLIYEHDPDFYLWLGSEDALPAVLEQGDDSSQRNPS